MEERKAKMVVNENGSGSITFRATLPTRWVRNMGLNENNRELLLRFDGEKISIENGDDERMRKREFRSREEIKKFLDEKGFFYNLPDEQLKTKTYYIEFTGSDIEYIAVKEVENGAAYYKEIYNIDKHKEYSQDFNNTETVFIKEYSEEEFEELSDKDIEKMEILEIKPQHIIRN